MINIINEHQGSRGINHIISWFTLMVLEQFLGTKEAPMTNFTLYSVVVC